MSEHVQIVEDAVSRLLEQASLRRRSTLSEEIAFHDALWTDFTDAGLPRMLVSESKGGSGADFDVAVVVAHLVGKYAVSLPLAETMLANWLAASAGMQADDLQSTLAIAESAHPARLNHSGDDASVSGTVYRVAWARSVQSVLVVGMSDNDPVVMRVRDAGRFASLRQDNVAHESRDTLLLDGLALKPDEWGRIPLQLENVLAKMALLRAAQLVGAMEGAFVLTLRYAGERNQFGRPLAKFQAIQHQIAVMAGELAACKVAVMVGAEKAGEADGVFHMAVAKARASEAATKVAAISHQVHGAIGFTEEYALHRMTRRIWSWRDDYGSENFWHGWLGERALADEQTPHALWKMLTRAA